MFIHTHTLPKLSALRTLARTATITFISKGPKCVGEFNAKRQQERGVCLMIQGQGNGWARRTSQKHLTVHSTVWLPPCPQNGRQNHSLAAHQAFYLPQGGTTTQPLILQTQHAHDRTSIEKEKDIKWSHFRGLPSCALMHKNWRKGERKKKTKTNLKLQRSQHATTKNTCIPMRIDYITNKTDLAYVHSTCEWNNVWLKRFEALCSTIARVQSR